MTDCFFVAFNAFSLLGHCFGLCLENAWFTMGLLFNFEILGCLSALFVSLFGRIVCWFLLGLCWCLMVLR